MANRLMNMHYNTSMNARNVLQQYHKKRPLADVENTFNLYFENNPFDYKKLIRRPETRISMKSIQQENDELVERAIKSAPNRIIKANAKKLREKQFLSKSALIHDKKDDKKIQFKKDNSSISTLKLSGRSKSSSNLNENSVNGQFMMLSMDEFKYSARKKQLNKKIHDYWKQDSAQLTKNAKSSSSIHGSDQWITIVNDQPDNPIEINGGNVNDNDNNMGNKSATTTGKPSLINLLTSGDSSERENVYQVSTDVGAIIAQKMTDGCRLVIGRNGEAVKPKSSSNSSRDKPNDETNSNRDAISRILEDLEETPIVPLSWNDQVQKNETKVLSPRKIEEKIIEKPVHERKIFVKKLVDEEEFKPKLRTELLNKYQLTQIIKPKHTNILNTITNTSTNAASLGKVTSVEIIGTNNIRNKLSQPQMFKLDSTEAPPSTTFNGIPTLSTTHDSSHPLNDENLSERQYNQIIENLTKQYMSHKSKTNISMASDQATAATQATVPPPSTANTLRGLNRKSDNTIKVNLQSVAHDYALASEIINRKKQMYANVNKAYNQLLLPLKSNKEIFRSRPNSPDLLISTQKKNMDENIIRVSIKTNPNGQAQNTNRLPKRSTNSISKAIKSSKQRHNHTGTEETMYINFTTSLEPIRRNSLTKQQQQQLQQNQFDYSDRYTPAFLNPSFSTIPDNPMPSRLD